VRLREPFVFFVDRSLGGRVVGAALRDAGVDVRLHDEHFAANAPDAEWLTAAGDRGWVVLTKDARIRVNDLERRALLNANVAAFMLGRGDVTGAATAAAFIAALPRMTRALRRLDVPFIGSAPPLPALEPEWKRRRPALTDRASLSVGCA
jgi:PIN like domain